MSQARCNARRRRQAKNKFAHMSGSLRRPRYHSKTLLSVSDAVMQERARARAEAARTAAKKK